MDSHGVLVIYMYIVLNEREKSVTLLKDSWCTQNEAKEIYEQFKGNNSRLLTHATWTPSPTFL